MMYVYLCMHTSHTLFKDKKEREREKEKERERDKKRKESPFPQPPPLLPLSVVSATGNIGPETAAPLLSSLSLCLSLSLSPPLSLSPSCLAHVKSEAGVYVYKSCLCSVVDTGRIGVSAI